MGFLKSADTAGAEGAMDADCLGELDIVGAIEAHIRWKIRLEAYISGESKEKLEADTVCRDDQCALGKWIHGVGRARFGTKEQFLSLENTHRRFHQCAGDVVRAVDRGDRVEARRLLTLGDYAKCSYQVKTELARLCRSTR